jgi:hypothetical protein
LFINALLKLGNIPEEEIDLNYTVETEKRTEKGNFIDLFIDGYDYRIIIENKIFATLNNDLNDYYDFAAKDSKKVIPFVLSLYPLNFFHEKYIFITYEMLFKEIRKEIGVFITDANQKYLTILFDFMKNIENLRRGSDMDLEFCEFVKDNLLASNDLNIKFKQLNDDFHKSVKSVNSIVADSINKDTVSQFIYREFPQLWATAVNDIKVEDKSIALDSAIDSNGWSFAFFIRPNQSKFDLKSFINRKNIKCHINSDERFQESKTFRVNENPNVIAEHIVELINLIQAI